jgi:glycosyltransferase involved in cell wall biosynthesis
MKVVFLSDYIEGSHQIASVRLNTILREFSYNYSLTIITERSNGKSSFGDTFFYNRFKIPRYLLKKNIYNKNKEIILNNDVHNNKYSKIEFSINKFIKQIFRTTETLLESSTLIRRLLNLKNYPSIKKKLDAADLIFITIPSVYPIEILRDIFTKKRSNAKVVVEIRDLVVNEISKETKSLRFKKAEDFIFKYGDAFIFLTEGIKKNYEPMIKNKPNIVITNGYDEELIDSLNKQNVYKQSKSQLANKQELIFLHLGSIYGGRNVSDFLNGILIFLENHLQYTITVKFIGDLDSIALGEISSFKQVIEENIHKNRLIIKLYAPVDNKEAMMELMNADIAVILTHRKGSEYAIPGKAFEYIGMEKPILAVSEDSGLIELIDGKFGVCSKHDKFEVARSIDKLLNMKIDYSSKNQYSRKKKSQEIVSFLNEVVMTDRVRK